MIDLHKKIQQTRGSFKGTQSRICNYHGNKEINTKIKKEFRRVPADDHETRKIMHEVEEDQNTASPQFILM